MRMKDSAASRAMVEHYRQHLIAMFTLGIVGYSTSVAVRLVGEWLMTWRTRQFAMEGKR